MNVTRDWWCREGAEMSFWGGPGAFFFLFGKCVSVSCMKYAMHQNENAASFSLLTMAERKFSHVTDFAQERRRFAMVTWLSRTWNPLAINKAQLEQGQSQIIRRICKKSRCECTDSIKSHASRSSHPLPTRKLLSSANCRLQKRSLSNRCSEFDNKIWLAPFSLFQCCFPGISESIIVHRNKRLFFRYGDSRWYNQMPPPIYRSMESAAPFQLSVEPHFICHHVESCCGKTGRFVLLHKVSVVIKKRNLMQAEDLHILKVKPARTWTHRREFSYAKLSVFIDFS